MNQKVKEELKQEFVQKLYGEFSTYREHLLVKPDGSDRRGIQD